MEPGARPSGASLALRAGGYAAIALVVGLALWTGAALDARSEARRESIRTSAALAELRRLEGALYRAESAQRGFVVTGDEADRQAFDAALRELPQRVAALRSMRLFDGEDARWADRLDAALAARAASLEDSVELKRRGADAEARARIGTAADRREMSQLAQYLDGLEAQGLARQREQELEWSRSVARSRWPTIGGSTLLLLMVVAGFLALLRARRLEALQTWIRSGELAVNRGLLAEPSLDTSGTLALDELVRRTGAIAAALYAAAPGARPTCVAAHGIAPDARAAAAGEFELVREVAARGEARRVGEIPANYFRLGSALGASDAAELLLVPATEGSTVRGVLELGFFRRTDEHDLELATRSANAMAIAIRTAAERRQLEEALEETQRQAEELETQQEELRVSNDALQERGRMLEQSKSRLELQQVELEQINSQLEEQAATLQEQKSALERAQAHLTEQSHALSRVSQYKSEFLANMSHELRTPLNSTLILARLLADNPAGNLSDEQVNYARTIMSAGVDLLGLINDILDLSKIEAGEMRLEKSRFTVQDLVARLQQTFGTMARDKGLALTFEVDPAAATTLATDEQRLSQILRNLIGNAIKFTDRGSVTVRVMPGAAPGSRIRWQVRDTGIGIAPEHQESIFEAFRQADGTTLRRFGGTGLGLTISRSLAERLGGRIDLHSVVGVGSTFVLDLPVELPDDLASEAHAAEANGMSTWSAAGGAAGDTPRGAGAGAGARTGSIDRRSRASVSASSSDAPPSGAGRERRTGPRRLLIVDDDPQFSELLRKVATERGFEAELAADGDSGLRMAIAGQPDAVVLDIKLPDTSGWVILDQLKHDPRTRHIPVHVTSGGDYAREALERGAVSYAVKSAQPEDLGAALRQLEGVLARRLRRILIVEDESRQREALRHLLAGEDVEIVACGTAAQADEILRRQLIDCVVLDLSLPDSSGVEILERMAHEEGMPFPPVIVYTGRSLNAEEEQRLRRYASTIILKDARSPERLLDEVALFLHQVESDLPPERQRMLRAARDRDARLEGRQVLIVEDDIRNVFALTSILEKHGVVTRVARNGLEALAALDEVAAGRASPIDLVLMDIMMPEMDGLTAMRRIRERPACARLPIIALTAKAMPDDRQGCLDAGASDYIAKPLDVDRLLSLIRVWVARPGTERP